MVRKLYRHSYEEIISLKNLLEAWQEFARGKKSRADVQEFERQLMPNLIELHRRLADMTYQHAPYEAFTITDPKTRSIHKASVADRVLHRALYRRLYHYFDRMFIADSYSCRIGKGAHRAIHTFERLARKESQNHHKTVWVLKCDIRKFFASVDQRILLQIIDAHIADKRIVWLIQKIVESFCSGTAGVGLPLGNLTSQLFSNVYLNVFDYFAKHRVRAKRYVRYADDLVILARDREWLRQTLPLLEDFLWRRLRLHMHPDKIELRTVASGIDFLGWVHFSYHRVLRTTTKRRMLKAMRSGAMKASTASYQGLLKHGNAFNLSSLVEDASKESVL